ncbi:hypothetical protein OIU74_021643 [Salix koriyanagi]|uniref:Protein kinase domain-containing protein n=1 Tax=Salix koriyanagi TaxID=2511006 RepID=A0A9Q1AE83_9ROSI|nr:hypothetical protein OIU74_021643 [Salix koriyanagi]
MDMINNLTPKPKKSESLEPPPPPPASTSSSSASSSINLSSSNYPSTDDSPTCTEASNFPSFSSKTSLSSLKDSLPENPHIYDLSEICEATNNFLKKPFYFFLFINLLEMLNSSHHSSVIKLFGVSSPGNYIYLVYEYVHGANLATCLRNPQNPSYTVLSSWLSRMQIATDIANGLAYIHHCSGLNSESVHGHIKSSSILVTGDSLNARICHFGTSELCGERVGNESSLSKNSGRSDSRGMRFEGTAGYMAPESQSSAFVTQKCDVYAFGVVVLELVSGEEALRYVFDKGGGVYKRISVIERAREVVAVGGGELRKWVDKRMKDSYPVESSREDGVAGIGVCR